MLRIGVIVLTDVTLFNNQYEDDGSCEEERKPEDNTIDAPKQLQVYNV